MGRFLWAVLLTGMLSGAAAAQSIGGAYNVAGTNVDGSPYAGQALITITSNTTCEIAWQTGGTTSKGFCMRNEDAFAAGYVLGKDIGLIIYKAAPDGTLRGVWTVAGQNGAGTEILTPIK
ncbi:hypothetical protein [Taklimakanibacter albus]|jgi:hypothetical protein|uniref:Uncharacterized protein n=1 Tax=Taklimakanibacter albus TaxID=2800327 RepID=A0ACC5R6M1_9HYPH|nr:hypothetical protein [Aestuariivirga sp. YIM B02566]MBK1868217.1 hypothetical protein [Aestuariivirga sp. YIM B02566]